MMLLNFIKQIKTWFSDQIWLWKTKRDKELHFHRIGFNTGVNDPCICGSKIKFKKCCKDKIPRKLTKYQIYMYLKGKPLHKK